MGQSEVLEVIEGSEKPLSRSQIAEALDCDPISISHLIKVLLKHYEIKCIELDRKKAAKMLGRKPKRRMRFYYI